MVSTIEGFAALVNISNIFSGFSSKLIKRLTQFAPLGEYPDFKAKITFFKVINIRAYNSCVNLIINVCLFVFFPVQNSFDFKTAKETGVIAPDVGVDSEYDSTQEKVKEIKAEFASYLKQQEKFFGCRLEYAKDKNRYEIEVPEKEAKKADDRFKLEGQRGKGKNAIRRFSTDETRSMLKELVQAEDEQNKVLKDLMRRMFEKFSAEYEMWKKIIDCIATLDLIMSFTVYAQNQAQTCFPEIVDNSADGPIIEIEDGVHPCIKMSDDFIPNGVTLGGKTMPPLVILTGPNMVSSQTVKIELLD